MSQVEVVVRNRCNGSPVCPFYDAPCLCSQSTLAFCAHPSIARKVQDEGFDNTREPHDTDVPSWCPLSEHPVLVRR